MSTSLRESILQYAIDHLGAEPEHLWAKYPDYVVLRHTGNRKWYAAFMDVKRSKLGLPGEDSVDILDLKCDPLLAGSLRASKGFLPAYHMNKDKWITVLLDGTVPQKDIIPLLEMSYDLTNREKRAPHG